MHGWHRVCLIRYLVDSAETPRRTTPDPFTESHTVILLLGHLLAATTLLAQASSNTILLKPWLQLDEREPPCERPLSIRLGREAFFEIANPVLGQTEYNGLVDLYLRGRWDKLEFNLGVFLETFGTSPLKEAATFLGVQAAFDGASTEDEVAEHKGEKKLREAFLLYPKSEYGPLAYAASAEFFGRAGQATRLVSLYRTALEKFPGSKYTCALRLGLADGLFLLRDYAASETELKLVQKTCHNFRLSAAVEVRLTEIGVVKGESQPLPAFEALIEKHAPYIEQFHPEAMYHLGREYYARNDLATAKYYYEQFVRLDASDSICSAYARKRLADIAHQSGEQASDLLGKYLSVYEHSPQSDIGRFSRAHALLLTSEPGKIYDLKRRLNVIDDFADEISDERLRFRVYLEKGLAMLHAQDPRALDYLERLAERRVVDFKQGDLGNWIRDQIYSGIANGTILGLTTKLETEIEALSRLDKLYTVWFQGTTDAAKIDELFRKRVASWLARTVENSGPPAVKTFIDRVSSMKLWSQVKWAPTDRRDITAGLLKWWLPKFGERAPLLYTHLDTLSPLLGPEFHWVLNLAQAETRPESGIQTHGTLTFTVPIPKSQEPYFQLAEAKLRAHAGQVDRALSLLEKVSFGKLGDISWSDPTALYLTAKRYRDGAEWAKRQLVDSRRTSQQKGEAFDSLIRFCDLGKLYVECSRVEHFAELLKLPQDKRKTASYVQGIALSHLGQWSQAVSTLDRLIPDKEAHPRKLEAIFRYGVCQSRLNRPEAARQAWTTVAGASDGFWSPLARNELNLSDGSNAVSRTPSTSAPASQAPNQN